MHSIKVSVGVGNASLQQDPNIWAKMESLESRDDAILRTLRDNVDQLRETLDAFQDGAVSKLLTLDAKIDSWNAQVRFSVKFPSLLKSSASVSVSA